MARVHNAHGITEEEFLQNYDITAFDQPSVTVDIVVMTVDDEKGQDQRKLAEKKLKALLIMRNEHPYIDHWALPGGFVRIDEDIEASAYRELREETGAEGMYLEQLYTYGSVARDPRGRIISNAYMALIDKESVALSAGTDASDAKWFDLTQTVVKEERITVDGGFDEHTYLELILSHEDVRLTATIKSTRIVRGRVISYKKSIVTNEGLAFDHALIIGYALERLRTKVEYTDIVFQMMPLGFTLTELQKTYETILDRNLLKANFRRKIAPMVMETDEMKKDGAYRPSKVFRFDPKWSDRKSKL